jgi:N-dimethylarginine dimethylaminohydrolase
MTKILMCDPEFFTVSYSINPWMNPEKETNSELAYRQWKNLVSIIKDVGAEVEIMSGSQKLPDIVFTANAAAIIGDQVVLANFKHPERIPEKEIYREWFESKGYRCVELPDDIIFEGAGDCLLRESKQKEVFLGHGFRSENIEKSNVWSDYLVRPLLLVNSYFYHLDTCFCPLPGDLIMLHPEAIHPDSLKELRALNVEFIEIPEEEARQFACNAVSIDENVIIPSGCPQTKKMLQANGFTVYDTDMSQFILSGGACKCLTLKV